MKYTGITEYNDWEGERWTVFVPEDDPLLEGFYEGVDSLGFTSSFEDDPIIATEEEVAALIKFSDSGYFPRYMKGNIAPRGDTDPHEYYNKLGWVKE